MNMQGIQAGGAFIAAGEGANVFVGVSESSKSTTATPARLVRIPFFPLRDKFAGRVILLDDLKKELCAGESSVLRQAGTIHADGGVGKTALAVELGWRLYEEEKFDYVFFLSASTESELQLDLERLCEKDALNLPEQAATDSSARRKAVLGWLHNNAARTLIILDNADDPEARAAARVLMPQLPGCAILVTSRHKGWGGMTEHRLELFSPEEAREFLRSHLPESLLADPCADARLDDIAREVDHLPLALEIVASYLNDTHQTPGEWLKEWHAKPASTIEHHDPDTIHYPCSLARVWEQSEAHLSPGARAILHQLAWIAPRPAALPLAIFKGREDWYELRVALSELAKAALIAWSENADEASIHRVLQAVLRHRLSEQEKSVSISAMLNSISDALPSAEWSEFGWRLWEQLAAHCECILVHLRDSPQEAAAMPLMNRLSCWYNYRSWLRQAEPLMRRAVTIHERTFGLNHERVATPLNNLAMQLKETNRLEEAEALMRRALALVEASFGKDHPNVARHLGNLAGVLNNTNQLPEAEALMRRALAIAEANLGNDHPDVAVHLSSLATLLHATNRLVEAELLMKRALVINEVTFGCDHPNVAIDLSNLAQLLRDTNRLAEAEQLMRRVLDIFEKTLGMDHPNAATALNNLATLLHATKRVVEAESLMKRALLIDLATYGDDHPNVATHFNNIAKLLEDTNRLTEAEQLMRKALAIFEKSLGMDHPITLTVHDNLAQLLEKRSQ